MTQAAMAVTYRLTEATRQDDARTLKDQFTAAAPVIAATPGLSWKISAIDAGRGVGLGLYLFDSGQNARVRERSPNRQGPARERPCSPESLSSASK